MRLRRKHDGAILSIPGQVRREHGFLYWETQHLESDYEEIKEDHWQDVTGECGFQEASPREQVRFFQHRVGTPDCNTLFEWPYLATIEGYRLRKVQLYEPLLSGESTSQAVVRWAFLVERKVSDWAI